MCLGLILCFRVKKKSLERVADLKTELNAQLADFKALQAELDRCSGRKRFP